MKKITEILKEKKFTVSVELVPPRNGSQLDEIFNSLKKLGKVDFVSITKGAGGSLRGGSLPISYFCQEKFGLNVIAHFVCRERTKYEIENDLVDLSYLGIRNILALRGDPPAGQIAEWDGDYKYAYLLVKQIKDMNNGKYMPRINFDENCREGVKTDFCIVVAGHPEDDFNDELEHIKAKVDAGAEVIITQMIFSFEDYKKYVESLRKNGITIPVIPGIRPLTSLKQCESVENFFKLKVTKQLKKGLKQSEAEKFGIEYSADMIQKLKKYGAPGVHLFILNDVDMTNKLLRLI